MKILFRIIVIVVAVLGWGVILFIGLIYYRSPYDHIDKSVPTYVKTITEFRKWQPTYNKAAKVEAGGTVFFIVTGEYARLSPSSPAEYYFDYKGNYINWNMDPGDFRTFPLINGVNRIGVSIDEIGK